MSEEVAVVIKAAPEVAEAFIKIFPDAQIRKIKKPEEKPQVKADTVEEREALLRQIVAYCRETKSNVDGVRFFNYYDGRGWVDARGVKIDDWKAKLKEWENNGYSNKSRNYTTAQEYEAKGGALAGTDINAVLQDTIAAVNRASEIKRAHEREGLS